MTKILYHIIYAIWYALSLLPLRALYVISDVLCLLISRVVKYRHRVIWNNLKVSFPEKSEDELRRIEPEDIRRAQKMMFAAAAEMLVLAIGVMLAVRCFL